MITFFFFFITADFSIMRKEDCDGMSDRTIARAGGRSCMRRTRGVAVGDTVILMTHPFYPY